MCQCGKVALPRVDAKAGGRGVLGEGVAGWNSGPSMSQPFLDFALRGDILVAE